MKNEISSRKRKKTGKMKNTIKRAKRKRRGKNNGKTETEIDKRVAL
ncbi:MAG: hypothetical protein ACLRIL_07915 [Fusicatenibacter saccharivorans]